MTEEIREVLEYYKKDTKDKWEWLKSINFQYGDKKYIQRVKNHKLLLNYITNLQKENENLKIENEEFKEIIKNLKEEFKHIKDRSRNNEKIIEQEKTIKNLNSFLERQEKDFNEEKMRILFELNEQIKENEKLHQKLNNSDKWKLDYYEDYKNQFKSQLKQLKIKDEQIESLQEQIYLLSNLGGNNTIPSDPNESLDN